MKNLLNTIKSGNETLNVEISENVEYDVFNVYSAKLVIDFIRFNDYTKSFVGIKESPRNYYRYWVCNLKGGKYQITVEHIGSKVNGSLKEKRNYIIEFGKTIKITNKVA